MVLSKKKCKHIEKIKDITEPSVDYCEECQKIGGNWVHLRTCQTCGVTLCCDQSPNKHASKHFNETKHPVIISAETFENWFWCYVDEQVVPY